MEKATQKGVIFSLALYYTMTLSRERNKDHLFLLGYVRKIENDREM